MPIDTHNIANLARISLTEDEHVSYTKDIQSILSFIDTIQSLSVTRTDAEKHSLGFAPIDVIRVDTEVLRPEEKSPVDIIMQAPASENNYVKVKKIITQ
jgi:aspartyl/glutamyl-tRNA(Asn/Gln) amidotransferase C subunit